MRWGGLFFFTFRRPELFLIFGRKINLTSYLFQSMGVRCCMTVITPREFKPQKFCLGEEVHLKNYLLQFMDKIAFQKEIYSRNRMDFWA